MTDIDKKNYPGNSKMDKPKKKVVTSAVVVEKHKPLLARIFGDNLQQVGLYVLWDVIIPAAKSTLTDIVTNGIEMFLYGESGHGPSRRRRGIFRDRGESYISYNQYYRDRDRTSRRPSPDRRSPRDRHDFENIIIESRSEAEEVLTILVEAIDVYRSCTVAEFYEAVGLPTEYTDHHWGWYNLTNARVKRGRYGYFLALPKPEPLD